MDIWIREYYIGGIFIENKIHENFNLELKCEFLQRYNIRNFMFLFDKWDILLEIHEVHEFNEMKNCNYAKVGSVLKFLLIYAILTCMCICTSYKLVKQCFVELLSRMKTTHFFSRPYSNEPNFFYRKYRTKVHVFIYWSICW